MKLETFFNNIEKIFRYLVPAFILTIFVRYSKGSTYDLFFSKISNIEFVFYFVLAGITIYSIHRVLFEIIDFLLFGCDIKKISEYIMSSYSEDEKTTNEKKGLKDYLYYKLATIHSALLSLELIIILILYEGYKTHPYLLIISSILFTISFIVYCIYHMIQKDIYEKNT